VSIPKAVDAVNIPPWSNMSGVTTSFSSNNPDQDEEDGDSQIYGEAAGINMRDVFPDEGSDGGETLDQLSDTSGVPTLKEGPTTSQPIKEIEAAVVLVTGNADDNDVPPSTTIIAKSKAAGMYCTPTVIFGAVPINSHTLLFHS
jgi:hypothetical protein